MGRRTSIAFRKCTPRSVLCSDPVYRPLSEGGRMRIVLSARLTELSRQGNEMYRRRTACVWVWERFTKKLLPAERALNANVLHMTGHQPFDDSCR